MARDPLSPEKTEELLHNVEVGRLGTSVDNLPYVVPVNFVYYEEKVYFHTGLKGRKLDNIQRNPNVCFQIDDGYYSIPAAEPCKFSANYFSVIVFGKARIVVEPDLRLRAMQALVDKYAPPGPLPAVEQENLNGVTIVEITPENITGADHARPRG